MYTSKRNIIIYLLSILLPSSLLNSFPSPFKRNKYLEFQKFIIFLLFFMAFMFVSNSILFKFCVLNCL